MALTFVSSSFPAFSEASFAFLALFSTTASAEAPSATGAAAGTSALASTFAAGSAVFASAILGSTGFGAASKF